MRKIILNILIILLLLAIGIIMSYLRPVKKHPEPKKLVAKFIFGRQGSGIGEFSNLTSLAIKDNHLYVADSGNSRIQILRIDEEGNLSAKFSFGKEGKDLGEFKNPTGATTKRDYLYVADMDSYRIQVLEIKY